MTAALETEIIEINDKLANNAKYQASLLSDVQKRKRGLIDILGINCAVSYLNSRKIRVNTKKSLYKIPLLYEEFKLSDIYYGNYRIDVITLYKEKNIKIPKVHVEMDILPHFYFVVQIGSRIKEAKPVGFIEGKSIPSFAHDTKFYYPNLNSLKDLNYFIATIAQPLPLKKNLSKHVDCLGLFLKFLDNDLSSVYKRQLIQHLMSCDSCRQRFIDTVEFEKLAKNIKFYPTLAQTEDKEEEIINSFDEDFRTLEESLTEEENRRTTEFVDLENAKKRTKKQSKKTNEDEIIKDIEDIEELEEIQDDNINDTDNTNSLNDNKQKSKEEFNVIDKSDRLTSSKAVIDAIFNEIPKIEFSSIKSVIASKNKRILILSLVSFLILIAIATVSLIGTDKAKELNEMAAVEEYNQNSDEYSEEDYYLADNANLANNSNLPTLANIENDSMREPITTKPTYSPSVSKVSFEAPGSIVDNQSYTKFLQLIGKTIKLNLQNDLLLIDDIPVNKMAKADISIMANGNVKSVKIAYSSGSKAIDNMILKVINETLKYSKPPSHGIVAKPAVITISLDLN